MDRDALKENVRSGKTGLPEDKGSAGSMIPLKRIGLGPANRSPGRITCKSFVNMLNHLHFTERQAYARMIHNLTGEEFLVRVFPEPSTKNAVTCSFPPDLVLDPEGFRAVSLIIDDGKTAIIMPVEQTGQSGTSFTAAMGEAGLIYSERQRKRFHCYLVDALVTYGSVSFAGRLVNFSTNSLKIWVDHGQDPENGTFGVGSEPTVKLRLLDQVVFHGRCRVLKTEDAGRSLIVQPINTHYARFKARKLRNPRVNLTPNPKVTFIHPLSNKRVTFEISDINTAGFSIEENTDTGELITGLIIPEATILFAGGLKIGCSVQVVYALRQRRKQCRFGFAVYDMDTASYNQLFDIYSNAVDRHANMSREVDMDALWVFFFESGFFYPEKYACLSQFREEFKHTYEKLYHGSQEIFTNFTYQNNGKIFGHVSMIKAYDRTWMIHHLAAKPMGRKRTGLYVLNHVLNYFDGLYRMPSVGMDYMIFYFRPENKFPDFFFGGFCRELNKPKACSLDCFAYINSISKIPGATLQNGWTLEKCTMEDISYLKARYEIISGGLMIDSFCLERQVRPGHSIEELYRKYDLRRSIHSFVLRYGATPRAFFIFDESDIGVNLSDLLNSIKVIVVDPEGLPWDALQGAVTELISSHGADRVPLMIYPTSYLDDRSIRYDKRYNLWVLDARYGDDYTEHLKSMARINIVRMLLKYVLSRIRKS